jgi:hypothetical protein
MPIPTSKKRTNLTLSTQFSVPWRDGARDVDRRRGSLLTIQRQCCFWRAVAIAATSAFLALTSVFYLYAYRLM